MIEVDKEIMLRLLDEEHAERIDDLNLVAIAIQNFDDLARRLAREELRYERVRSAIRGYSLSVEEWEDEEGIDDPHKYQSWKKYI
jgi:hypothetical protein